MGWFSTPVSDTPPAPTVVDLLRESEAARRALTDQIHRLTQSTAAVLERVKADHAREMADATRRAAVQQQNFDWLAAHVNRLEAERALLLHRILDLRAVAPVIETGQPTLHTQSGPPLGPIAPPIPTEARPEAPEGGVDIPGLLTTLGSSFEDMGDGAAKLLGVTHTDDGHLLYTR